MMPQKTQRATRFFKTLLTDVRFQKVRSVLLFVVITLIIHYTYRFWANQLHYWPIASWMQEMHRVMAMLVYEQSVWVNQHILHIPMTFTNQTMWFSNGSGISINASCSGDKQILQFALLMLLYPGPWRKKLWFIPLGMLLVHLTNILRIVLLSVVAINDPSLIKISHDTLLRAMFYVVIFALWAYWEEKRKD